MRYVTSRDMLPVGLFRREVIQQGTDIDIKWKKKKRDRSSQEELRTATLK